MRRFARSISLLAVVFASAVTLLAQAENPFAGKWTLNVAKSKFNPGPPPKDETVTIANGTTTVEGTDATGKPFKWSVTPAPGKAVPIDGIPNATLEEKLSGDTVDHTWKGAGGNTHGHGVVSKDRKTMRYTQNGTDDQGHPMHNLFIFEKSEK
jgi:hypothetical protein